MIIFKWKTIVGDFKDPVMECLVDSKTLIVVIRDLESSQRARVEFTGNYVYRSIDESYRSNMWDVFPFDYGHTVVLEDSPFFAEVIKDEIAEQVFEKSKVYLIKTQDDVIEVICDREPIVETLPVGASDELFGKSIVFRK